MSTPPTLDLEWIDAELAKVGDGSVLIQLGSTSDGISIRVDKYVALLKAMRKIFELVPSIYIKHVHDVARAAFREALEHE